MNCNNYGAKQRFGLRKLSIGIVSVMLGLTMYGVNTAHADGNPSNITTNVNTNRIVSQLIKWFCRSLVKRGNSHRLKLWLQPKPANR